MHFAVREFNYNIGMYLSMIQECFRYPGFDDTEKNYPLPTTCFF